MKNSAMRLAVMLALVLPALLLLAGLLGQPGLTAAPLMPPIRVRLGRSA